MSLFFCVFVCQQLLEEQLSVKQGLYLASFGTNVQPLWKTETPRVVNATLYDRMHPHQTSYVLHLCTSLALGQLVKHWEGYFDCKKFWDAFLELWLKLEK